MNIKLCSKRQGILTLATEDGYLMAMKNWEFAAKTDGKTKTLETFRTFLSKQVLSWDNANIEKLNRVIGSLSKKLDSKLHKGLANVTVQVIKTTGLDEWKSAYTRKWSIVLPVNKVEEYSHESLEKLIVHEIFHILSRNSTELRAMLYETLGFVNKQVNVSDHSVFQLQLVNPDALDINWVFPVVVDDIKKWIMPIIFLKDGLLEFDAGDIFDRIAFELYEMDVDLKDGRLIGVSDSESFSKKFGAYGFMAHHPEELLAEAFVDYIFDDNRRFINTDWYMKCCEIFKEFRI